MKNSKKCFLVAIVSLVVGVIFTCIFGADPNASSWALFALFITFFVFAVAVFCIITGLINERRSTCRSCKQVMKGAGYEIDLLDETDTGSRQVARYEVTVKCPFCGEVQSFCTKETVAYTDKEGNVHYRNGLHSVERYCKALFRDK